MFKHFCKASKGSSGVQQTCSWEILEFKFSCVSSTPANLSEKASSPHASSQYFYNLSCKLHLAFKGYHEDKRYRFNQSEELLCGFAMSGKTWMANVFGKGSFLLPGQLGFYNIQQQWLPTVLNGGDGHGRQESSTLSQRVRNPGSSFIHIIVMILLMTVNTGIGGRNALR